jgi:hypothetical protein
MNVNSITFLSSLLTISEHTVRILCQANVHDHYVEHTLNPFSKLKSPIVSPRFAKAVWTLVQNFNGKKAS